MTNPARELHESLSRWRELTAAGNIALRQVIDPTSPEGAATVMRVARLLARVDDVLTDLDSQDVNVDLYRRQYPDWVTAMVSYQLGWAQPLGADNIITVEVLDEIEGLANYLDGKVYELGSRADTLQCLLNQAKQALAEDVELDPRLTQYLHRLLQQIQNALDDEMYGIAFDYADAVQRLWVAFRAAEGASPQKSAMWRDLWTQIIAGTASGSLVTGSSMIIQALTTG